MNKTHRALETALSNEESVDISRVGVGHVKRLPKAIKVRCMEVSAGLQAMGIRDDPAVRLKRAAKLYLQVKE